MATQLGFYINQQYCMGIEGMTEGEGRELIDDLCRHITREEAQYRHRWASSRTCQLFRPAMERVLALCRPSRG